MLDMHVHTQPDHRRDDSTTVYHLAPVTLTQGSKSKKAEVAFWQLIEKDKLPISKFKLLEGIGAPKAGKQIQNCH